MDVKLVVVAGETDERQYDLELPSVIGRSRSADLTLAHPLVSRQHCEVFEDEGVLMVRDLGSRNGTFVGDTRITEQAVPVKPNDMLMVGGVTFRADYRERQAATKPPTWNATGPTVPSPLTGVQDDVHDTTTRRDRRQDEGENDAPAKP